MPFKSDAQRRFMYSQHPELAKEFEDATPEGKELPEHVKKDKKMADGGIPEDQDKMPTTVETVDAEPNEFIKELGTGIKEGVNHDSDAVRSYLSSTFNKLLGKKEEMAEGGVPGVTFLENEDFPTVKETIHLEETASPNEELAAKGHEEHYYAEGGVPTKDYAHGGVTEKSDDEKRAEIYKAMGMDKYAIGGIIPQPPTGPALNIPNQNDPNFWEQIKNALAKVSAPITKPIGAMTDMATGAAEAATPVVRNLAAPTVSALNTVTGLDLPVPPAPPAVPQGAPTELSAPVPPTPPSTSPSVPPVAPTVTKTTPASSGPDMKNLFNQDTSKLTEGVEGTDRQQVVDNLAAGQGGLGSIIAQAVAGLGDALAAKGGRDQHALKDIFSMQKQQRDEALANFDKQRQSRLEQLDLKTKMGNNAINQLAAQDAYGVDENLNKQLGAPPGTKHKDLPLYMQMASAKAAQSEKDADLYMKAHKQAADEIEQAVKNAGIFNIKPSPEQMRAQGAKLADQYFNRAKGNVLFQPSDGQKPVWIPAKNIEAAKKMDPQGQIIQ